MIDCLRGTAPDRARTRLMLAALAAIACAALIPSAASANSVNCHGSLSQTKQQRKEKAHAYAFRCSEAIGSYSIVSSRVIEEFSPDTVVFVKNSSDPAQGEAFQCEGAIPGFGFGCGGKASASNMVTGSFVSAANYCALPRSRRPGFWLVAVDTAGKASHPFALRGPACPRPKTRR